MDRRTLRFTKMHGAGNDYIYVDAAAESLPDNEAALKDIARRISHRNTGVGGDGLILVMPPTTRDADVRMRMFNLDGSEGQMCGNGIRCVAKFAVDRGLIAKDVDSLKIETYSGVRRISLLREGEEIVGATVDMGEPRLGIDAVNGRRGSSLIERVDGPSCQLPVHGDRLVATLVSMGNPHAVIFVDDLASIDLPAIGPALATHAAFPDEINAHFVQVLDRTRVRVLHWERGSGPTLACGTGTCAVTVAGSVTGRTERNLEVHVPGGVLNLRWDEMSNVVHMTGPAVEVFRGEWRG